MAQHQGKLGEVYNANSPSQIAEIYDKWAASYDEDMARSGYCHPSICLALLARYLPSGSAPVLDAGAGTGLVGEWMSILGYPQIEALDVSAKMLEIARQKEIYSALHHASLTDTLPFIDGQFAAVVSSGVFTTGHVGAEGLDELLRICRSGGILVLTVKVTLWDEEFAKSIETLARKGKLKILERTQPYVSMPGETGTVPSLAIVLCRQ